MLAKPDGYLGIEPRKSMHGIEVVRAGAGYCRHRGVRRRNRARVLCKRTMMPSVTRRRVVWVAKAARNPRPQDPSPGVRWRVDVIAIGASAGGFSAIAQVLAALAVDAPAVLVVQHLDPKHKSFLAGLLAQKTSRVVKQAEHDEPIHAGKIYVCPPDQHMLVAGRKVELSHSELVHFSRPSIDLLFESVAGRYGTRCMGVILSGSNSDGATGIRAIRQAGGITLAQQPASAEFRIMPQAAIATGCIDFIVPLDTLGREIMRLCGENHLQP